MREEGGSNPTICDTKLCICVYVNIKQIYGSVWLLPIT